MGDTELGLLGVIHKLTTASDVGRAFHFWWLVNRKRKRERGKKERGQIVTHSSHEAVYAGPGGGEHVRSSRAVQAARGEKPRDWTGETCLGSRGGNLIFFQLFSLAYRRLKRPHHLRTTTKQARTDDRGWVLVTHELVIVVFLQTGLHRWCKIYPTRKEGSN